MKVNTNPTKINEVIGRGVEEVIDKDNLAKQLASGKQLRIKLGIDPTAADLHLGHSVVLRKLAQFQQLGHVAVLIIGDFTTLIGDPSGRTTSRPSLSAVQIRDNMKDYISQASKILDIGKAEIHYNSEWFGDKLMSFLMDLAGRFTVARLIEREDFQKRLKGGFDVSMLELLYPLLQGYDSVACKADVEIGGYDQRLNLLFGRKVLRAYGLPEQDVLTVPLLIGTDGEKKMSKSVGNYIRITEEPNKMFTQVMAVPDNLIWNYFQLVTDLSEDEINKMRAAAESNQLHPKDAKMKLADQIVSMFHNKTAGDRAKKEFIRVTQENQLPSDIPTVEIKEPEIGLLDLLVVTGAADSTSAARRLVMQKSVIIDDVAQDNVKAIIKPKDGQLLKVGKKRFYRIAK